MHKVYARKQQLTSSSFTISRLGNTTKNEEALQRITTTRADKCRAYSTTLYYMITSSATLQTILKIQQNDEDDFSNDTYRNDALSYVLLASENITPIFGSNAMQFLCTIEAGQR